METLKKKISSPEFINRPKHELSVWLETLDQIILLYETDLEGRFIDINDQLLKISQYRREELIGSPCHILRHYEMPKALFKLLWQTISTGNPFKGVVKNRKKDGTPFWVELAIMPVKDSDNNIIKYVCASNLIHEDRIGLELYMSQMKTLDLPWKEDTVKEGAFMMVW